MSSPSEQKFRGQRENTLDHGGGHGMKGLSRGRRGNEGRLKITKSSATIIIYDKGCDSKKT